MKKYKSKNYSGFTLLEILVVVSIFAVLGILVTRSVILTLQGTQKTESLIRARENLDYSLNIIERGLRGASSIPGCATNLDTSTIGYLDQDGQPASFSCINSNGESYIASGSSNIRLTTDSVRILDCSFLCTPSSAASPPYVSINLTVQDASASGIPGTEVTAQTQIYLRNY
ncbi:MAG: type II secretion system protein [Candidatus Microgenomates bacterium]|jgi:prepilin-type N-terminal cleavage/methylation domain-containing protein